MIIYTITYILINTVLSAEDTEVDKTFKNGVTYLESEKNHKKMVK